ncbi:AAA family ATPase [Congzhengia minquanensis]|uniref:AAA family ATPase n=1 Tax=Congzhengia minquanensis TaxID=2763657 RepID=A0A926DN71_9FIRM|nr:AAA family ATPase [Congzhengia minquanensis]MBC8540774.1 AAA family ATPase [Congzhengia minquanensis]
MAFQIKKAKREKIYVKVALMSPSGGGKTYSALRLATGMANEIEKQTGTRPKILLGNTEAKRGYYYADEFDYDIVDIDAPHNPEKYVEFVNFAVSEGYGILIIDSSSHEWEGKGGCLELQQQAGGTYQAWAKVTPRHNKFIEAIADSPIHIIATMRGKDQYEVEKDEKGKTSVKKLGVGAKQRDGFEYEFTCTLLIDQKTHMAETQKDNTHIFENETATLLNETYGEKIMQWANSGEGYTPVVRKDDEDTATTDNIAEIKKEIVATCGALGGTKNEELMTTLKAFVPSGNPNAIKSIDDARKCLEKIQGIKAVQA